MSSKHRKVVDEVERVIMPVMEELGIDIVDIEYAGKAGNRTLGVFLDRPGGITVDELQEASRSIEILLEIEDIFPGAYRLEVSSPGIDRPMKRREDYSRNVGSKVDIKLCSPLPDGRRHLSGRLAEAGADEITITLDDGDHIALPYTSISRAKPKIDWDQLLKQSKPQKAKGSRGRRTS